VPAQQRERKLAGKQLVISKPRPSFALRLQIRKLRRTVYMPKG